MQNINVTDKQKKYIEAHGMMVIEFKQYCMRLSEAFQDIWEVIERFVRDTMNAIFEVFYTLSEKLGTLGILHDDEVKELIDGKTLPKRKYQICKELGIPYEPFIKRQGVYHRRNNC